MKRFSSIDLSTFKRPAVLVSLAVVLVLAGAWWFAWMSPQGAKLSSVNQQETTKQAQLYSLQTELATSRYDVSLLQKYGSYLQRFTAAVPPTPEAQVLTTQLFQLAAHTVGSRHLTALSDDTTAPPTATQPLGEVPLTIDIAGPYDQCVSFLRGLYKLPRLITISSITPSPQSGPTSAGANLLDVNGQPYTMTISATAYFSPSIG